MNLCFVTLTVKNMEETQAFYTEVIGLKELRRFSPRPGVRIVFLQDERGGKVELIETAGQPHKQEQRLPVSLGFAVADIGDTEQMLRTKGVEITGGPQKVPNGETLLFVQDPDGVGITFIQGFQE